LNREETQRVLIWDFNGKATQRIFTWDLDREFYTSLKKEGGIKEGY